MAYPVYGKDMDKQNFEADKIFGIIFSDVSKLEIETRNRKSKLEIETRN